MPDQPTVGEFYKAKTVSEEQLEAAVDAFMADPTIDHLVIAEGVTMNPSAAVTASEHARALLAMAEAKAGSKRSAVRSAILLARVK